MKKLVLLVALVAMLGSASANAGTFVGVQFDYANNLWLPANAADTNYLRGNYGLGKFLLGYSFNNYFGANIFYSWDRAFHYNNLPVAGGTWNIGNTLMAAGADVRFVFPVVPIYLYGGVGWGQQRIWSQPVGGAYSTNSYNGFMWEAGGGLQFTYHWISLYFGASVAFNYNSAMNTDAYALATGIDPTLLKRFFRGEAGILINWGGGK